MVKLQLQYVPHYELQHLSSEEKIRKLLKIVKAEKIILLEGKLSSLEEAKLIEITMQEIKGKFKGIEICTISSSSKNLTVLESFSKTVYSLLLGKREGLTIIGPATIVKEIKRNPRKIELLLKK